jgi:hypothetical protein
MSQSLEATALGTDLITALGGPAVVGGILLGLLKRSLTKTESEHSERFENMAGKFDVVASEMKDIIESNKTQEAVLSEIKTKIAIAEQQSLNMARAIEDVRQMDKQLVLMQSKVEAAFRIIDDIRSRTDRLDGKIDRVDSDLSNVREILRSR